ncbi:MAG: F0F1 ATP synthase subunit epsilon [Candidatus Acidiferrales bacterium]
MSLPEAIELQVVTPQRHVLQETVQAIEMPGKEGYLGILPGHAPLITELGVGILAYRKSGETRYVTIVHGYAEVLPDRVIVLAELSERAEEIDAEKARAEHEQAQAQLLKTSTGSPDWQEQKLAVERAVVRAEAAAKWGGFADSHK